MQCARGVSPHSLHMERSVVDDDDATAERDVLRDPLETWAWMRARSTAECLVTLTLGIILLCSAVGMGVGAYKLAR